MLNATIKEVSRINDIIRRHNVYYWAVHGPASYPAPAVDVRSRPLPTEGC